MSTALASISRRRCYSAPLFAAALVALSLRRVVAFTGRRLALPAFAWRLAAPPSTRVAMSSASDLQFGKFRIDASFVFWRTSLSAAFVNLRPIVSGHVLVIPQRGVPRLLDLTEEETVDLWITVRHVQQLLSSSLENATDFNVAVQDGRAAGQSVPHVHVHILPRRATDAFAGSDDIYHALEEWAPTVTTTDKPPMSLQVPHDSQRRDRTPEEMATEAATYRARAAEQQTKETEG